jgi:hypothetical protein
MSANWVRNECLEADRRTVKAAEENKAKYIFLAGDKFEDNGFVKVLV